MVFFKDAVNQDLLMLIISCMAWLSSPKAAHIPETGMAALQGAAQDLALDPEFKRRYLGL